MIKTAVYSFAPPCLGVFALSFSRPSPARDFEKQRDHCNPNATPPKPIPVLMVKRRRAPFPIAQ